MKTFLAIALFVMICFNGTNGQITDLRTWGNRLNKALNLENRYSIPTQGDKLKMQYPNLLKKPIGNQLKSAFEGNQRLDSLIYERWDTVSNQFVPQYYLVYNYDAYGYESSYIEYQFDDTSSQWYLASKYETTYDTNGNLTLYSTYDWDANNSLWIFSYKYEWTYDEYGNLILEMFYMGSSDQILSGYKYANTYDGNGYMTLDSTYILDVSNNQWNLSGKTEYNYDANGNMTSEIGYSPDVDEYPIQWSLSWKWEYAYNSAGNMTSWTNFDYFNTEWYIDMKQVFTYDDNENMVLDSMFWYEFDSVSYYYKQEHTYDINGNKTSAISYERIEPFGEWIFQDRETYYYSEFTPTPVTGISGKEIRVYPNPAKEYVVFDIANISSSSKVELYDLQGKKVLEQGLSYNNRVLINKLSKGLYLYRLYDNGNVYKGKITVE